MFKKVSSIFILFIIFIPLFFQNPTLDNVQGHSPRSIGLLNAVADTSLFNLLPDQNFGDNTILYLFTPDWDMAITLVKFDLSSLPSDAVVIEATMWLNLVGSSGDDEATFGVYLITSPWDEAAITWNSASDLTTSITGISSNMDDDLGWKSISGVGDYVQNWINDPLTNYGLMLRPLNESSTWERNFHSRESDVPSLRPYLEVTYYQKDIYHQLGGRVYQGNVGDESKPIENVRLDLFCSFASDDLGTLVDTTTTNSDGWYGLNGYYGCDYYNIIESDPNGYFSTGATTVHGAVINANHIQYQAPLSGKIHTGNKFWDKTGYKIYLPLIIK